MKRLTSKQKIEQYLANEIKKKEIVIVHILNRVGLNCTIEARNRGNYLDQTGNLRSSIGYAVLRGGRVAYRSDFNKVKQGEKGQLWGKSFLKEVARKYNHGIVLIVVAGMNYAAYVETKRNVIASAELLAKQQVPRLLKSIGFKNIA